jgi:hypothetical protein
MKKIALLVALSFFLQTLPAFADAIFLAVKTTPYDKQMARIHSVLTTPVHASAQPISLVVVNHWMSSLRSIPYGFTVFWKTPAETQSGAPADCKAKAVALYQKMRSQGANVRLVIGKRTPTSRRTHAWLAWNRNDVSYILDPTFKSTACPTTHAGKRDYQPFYGYSGAKKFRAASILVAQN